MATISSLLMLSVLTIGDVEKTSFRAPVDDADLKYWLTNMLVEHRFTLAEATLATGLEREAIEHAIKRLGIDLDQPISDDGKLRILPYPGGRHPRLGFLDGAIRPQRETKVSIFPPWRDGGYLVLDIPEAIWADKRLLYLAHTHVPTIWDEKKIELEPLEWVRSQPGKLSLERKLPNGVVLRSNVTVNGDRVELSLSLTNGTPRRLTDLRVQMCAMLGHLNGFEQQTNDNKLFDGPVAACKDRTGDRWVLLAFEPIHRAWGNPPCPCLHADPIFPDAEPGATVHVQGAIRLHQGADIRPEIKKLRKAISGE